MRRLAYSLIALCVACGDSAPGPPAPAKVRWNLSATTCQGGGPIVFIVDGTDVGTEGLQAGQTSSEFDVKPGDREISARTEIQPGINWTPHSVTLTPGEHFTRVLECCPFCSQQAR